MPLDGEQPVPKSQRELRLIQPVGPRAGGHECIIRPDPGSLKFLVKPAKDANAEDQQIADQVLKTQQSSWLEAPLAPLEKPEFAFVYRYTSTGQRHEHVIHDWEVQQAYRQYKHRYGDAALDHLTRMYGETIPAGNLHFIMGTMAAHPRTFIVIGLLRSSLDPAELARQGTLFQPQKAGPIMARSIVPTTEHIARSILVLRGQRVILDRDLAAIYGVTTKRLNEQVRRNAKRFPEDFVFQLTAEEAEPLRSQIATSKSPGRGGRRYRPYAFTEHGAIQAANVLSSPRAVEMGIYVVRAFVKLRELLASNKDLARRLDELEARIEKKLTTHDEAIAAMLSAIRQLMNPSQPKRRGIGFTADIGEDD